MGKHFGTVDDYTRALQSVIAEGVPQKHMALVKAHCAAPGRTCTANKLARAVGYANFRGVNLQYGKLAHRVARELGVPEPPKGFWLYVLVDWAGGLESNGHTRFVLRDPVVQALDRLGYTWARRVGSNSRSVDRDYLLSPEQKLSLRKLIRGAQWKQASSPQYQTVKARHSYIVHPAQSSRMQGVSAESWEWFRDLIKQFGVRRSWNGHPKKYLIFEATCYWVEWPVLNRALTSTLDPLPEEQQERARQDPV